MRRIIIGTVFLMCMGALNGHLAHAQEVICRTEVVSTDPHVVSDKVFYVGEEEVARQRWMMRDGQFFGGNPEFVSAQGQIRDGIVKEYAPGGELVFEGEYENSRQHGLSTSYMQDGRRLEMIYHNGQMRKVTMFDESGNLIGESAFDEHGEIIGTDTNKPRK